MVAQTGHCATLFYRASRAPHYTLFRVHPRRARRVRAEAVSMGTKRILVAGKSRDEVSAKFSVHGGVVGLEFSGGIFSVIVPDTHEDTSTQLKAPSTGKEPGEDVPSATHLGLGGTSDLEAEACEAFKDLEIIKVERPVPFTKKGKVAIALLFVAGEGDSQKFTDAQISKEILPGLLQGAESLKLGYPNSELDIQFKPYRVTLSASSQVPNASLTSWPSAVPFKNNLYVFYQGNSSQKGRALFNVFDPTTGIWKGTSEVPSSIITDGPSAVVFNDQLYLFYSGDPSRHEIWYNVFDGTSWSGAVRINNTRLTGGPSVVVHNGKIYCFHQGFTKPSNVLWYNVYDGTKWLGDTLVPDTSITESPAVLVFQDKIYCFYKGEGDLNSTLLLNRFDPLTEKWSGHVAVPYTESTTKGLSAVVFDDKIYLFHRSGDQGELWFNTSTDGSLWLGDTPLTHEMSTDGLGTTVFSDKLYCFFQGADKNVEALMHRSFAKGNLGWEDVWSLPALASLGHGSYAGLAEAVRVELKADYGYVACCTKLPLLYSSYADESRLCMQYPHNDIATTFAKIFDATGVHDVSTHPTNTNPRYTFALVSDLNDTVPITSYATGFVFHQGLGTDSGKRLWFSFLDRRSGNWTEMQGPVTSSATGGNSGVFLSNSKLYVFYRVDRSRGELHYNILDGFTWKGEEKVPGIRGITGSPSAVFFQGNIHSFYQGANLNGELWHNVLDTNTGTWKGEDQIALERYFLLSARMISGPSSVVFRNNVHSLYNGSGRVTLQGNLRANVFNGSKAINDMEVPITRLQDQPSAVVYNGKLYGFHQGNVLIDDGAVWFNRATGGGEGDSWDGDEVLKVPDGFLIQDAPSAMALEGKLYCFFRGRGQGNNDKLWYNVLDRGGWGVQKILPTASGIGGQHGALATGSLCIQYGTTPPVVERVI